MSANYFSLSLLVGLALLAPAGCATRAEQTASQSDVEWFGRVIRTDPYASIDPDAFLRDASQMVLTPIEFYGQVVDEEGEPIEDAEVDIVVFDRVVDPFEFPYFAFSGHEPTRTGRNGRFNFTDLTGAGLYVLVTYPGYQPVTAPRRMFVYAEGLNPREPIPTADDPAVFVFEPRPPEAELQLIRTGALKLPNEGEALPVSLRTVAPYGPEPGAEDAIVRCNRDVEDAQPSDLFGWWCEIEIPGGGVLSYLLEFDSAPESGYVPRLRFGHDADDERWDDRDERDIIVRFADGTYASINMQMRMDGDYYIAFEGVWNPSGSRWLD